MKKISKQYELKNHRILKFLCQSRKKIRRYLDFIGFAIFWPCDHKLINCSLKATIITHLDYSNRLLTTLLPFFSFLPLIHPHNITSIFLKM